MHSEKLRSQLFQDILKAAAEENLMRSVDALPPDDELKKEYGPSPELWRKVREKVRQAYRKARLRKAVKITKKVAVILAIIIPISLGSLLSVQASRNAIFNLILDWKSDHTNIHYEEASSGMLREIPEPGLFAPKYIPSGFSKSKETKVGSSTHIIYTNKSDVSIVFEQCPASKAGTLQVDSEHTNYSEISIHGQKASLFAAKTPNDNTFIVWQDDQTAFMINSTGDKNELIKMAESIERKNN